MEFQNGGSGEGLRGESDPKKKREKLKFLTGRASRVEAHIGGEERELHRCTKLKRCGGKDGGESDVIRPT